MPMSGKFLISHGSGQLLNAVEHHRAGTNPISQLYINLRLTPFVGDSLRDAATPERYKIHR